MEARLTAPAVPLHRPLITVQAGPVYGCSASWFQTVGEIMNLRYHVVSYLSSRVDSAKDSVCSAASKRAGTTKVRQ